MSSPGSPAQPRSYVVERMIGASGAEDQVTAVARNLADRCLPILTKGLNEKLSSPVEIEVTGVEIGRQGDMREAAGPNGALTVVASATSGDAMILAMDPAAIGVITNALFGGEPDTAITIQRSLSAIEIEVAALVFDRVADSLNGTGSRSLNLKFPLNKPVTGEDLRKMMFRDGPSVRVRYSVFTRAGTGSLVFAMPQRVLLQYRGGKVAVGQAMAAGDWSKRLGSEVIRSSVTLQATIAVGRMALGELAALEVGEVIDLPVNAQSQTRLGARNRPLFIGDFGKLGQHYTICIRQPFDAGQDLMDGILPSSKR